MNLSKEQIKILKFIRRNNLISYSSLAGRFPDANDIESDLRFLTEQKYIKSSAKIGEADYQTYIKMSSFTLTNLGRDYLEDNVKDKFVTWYPYVASTIAIILSLIALFK